MLLVTLYSRLCLRFSEEAEADKPSRATSVDFTLSTSILYFLLRNAISMKPFYVFASLPLDPNPPLFLFVAGRFFLSRLSLRTKLVVGHSVKCSKELSKNRLESKCFMSPEETLSTSELAEQ